MNRSTNYHNDSNLRKDLDLSRDQDFFFDESSFEESSTASQLGTTTEAYTSKDIVSGRGGLANKHSGNRVYRRLIAHNKPLYRKLNSKALKSKLIESILMAVANQGGRFLKFDDQTQQWTEIDTKEAFIKTSQALREPDHKKKNAASGAMNQKTVASTKKIKTNIKQRNVETCTQPPFVSSSTETLDAIPLDLGDCNDCHPIDLAESTSLFRALSVSQLFPDVIESNPESRCSESASYYKTSTGSLLDDMPEDEMEKYTKVTESFRNNSCRTREEASATTFHNNPRSLFEMLSRQDSVDIALSALWEAESSSQNAARPLPVPERQPS